MPSTKDKFAALVAAQSDDDDYVYFADPADPIMDAFFTAVQNIRDMTDKIRDNIDQIKEAHDIILATPDNDERTKQRLESLMDDTDRTVNRVRVDLKKLKMLEEEDSDETSSYSRMRSMQLFSLSTTVVELMTEYNRIKVDYRERCKARLKRQLEIAGRQSITDDQLDDMLERGSVAIFTQDIITETAQARLRIADIEARHADIVKLEKSITELHDMFVDMAMMVETQGELLDRIEYHVSLARDLVVEAKEEVHHAQTFQQSARKKKIAIAICLLITVVILVALLAGFLS